MSNDTPPKAPAATSGAAPTAEPFFMVEESLCGTGFYRATAGPFATPELASDWITDAQRRHHTDATRWRLLRCEEIGAAWTPTWTEPSAAEEARTTQAAETCPDCGGNGFVEYPTDCGGCSGLLSPAHEPGCGIDPCPRGCANRPVPWGVVPAAAGDAAGTQTGQRHAWVGYTALDGTRHVCVRATGDNPWAWCGLPADHEVHDVPAAQTAAPAIVPGCAHACTWLSNLPQRKVAGMATGEGIVTEIDTAAIRAKCARYVHAEALMFEVDDIIALANALDVARQQRDEARAEVERLQAALHQADTLAGRSKGGHTARLVDRVRALHEPGYGGGVNEVCVECGAGSGCSASGDDHYDCFDRSHTHWPCPTRAILDRQIDATPAIPAPEEKA